MKDEEVTYRYINGILRPLKFKKTNDYMNEKIRDSVIRIKQKDDGQIYEFYHGSPYDFNEFDDEWIGKNSLGGLAYGNGHYFTFENTNNIYGKYTYKVRVKLKKPFIVQERQFDNELINLGYKWNQGIDKSDFLASKGYDSTILKNDDKITEVIIYSNEDKKIEILNRS